jgi:hypothetical protein
MQTIILYHLQCIYVLILFIILIKLVHIGIPWHTSHHKIHPIILNTSQKLLSSSVSCLCKYCISGCASPLDNRKTAGEKYGKH